MSPRRGSLPKSLHLRTKTSIAFGFNNSFFNDGNFFRKTQVSEIIEIEHIPTHPNMITWAPIRRNVLTEDDHYHSNIPYFGDTEIGSNFIKSFEENVNNKMNIFNADNEDSMFMDLVNSLANVEIRTEDESELLEEPKTEAEKKWHLSSCHDNSLPGLVVFQAIAKKYPDYANVEDLIKKFKKLSDVQATTNLVQDLDGPNAQAISAEAAIHSYKSLLCRRCFKYDCPLHNDPFVDEPAKVDKEEAPLPSRPCGPDCFLNLPGVQGLLSPLTPRSSTKGGTELTTDPALAKRVAKKLLGEHYTEENLNRWVNSEITLFRMLAKTFQSNWCAIAQGVMTKTCKQVYEFSKQELGNAVNNKKTSSSLPRRQSNKTGKKKHTKAKQAALYKVHFTFPLLCVHYLSLFSRVIARTARERARCPTPRVTTLGCPALMTSARVDRRAISVRSSATAPRIAG